MYQALRALGKTVEFVRYQREEHGFEEPNHRIDEATRWLAWFAKYVKREAPPAYEPGVYAPAGDWEYTVASVDGDAQYAGRTARGRFVEVTILLRNATPASGTNDVSSGAVALRLSEGGELHPVGAVVSGAGAKALATGDVHLSVGPAGAARTYVPLVVAFDVPAETHRATVRVGSGPEFTLDIAGK
jgi:hypothetical protein